MTQFELVVIKLFCLYCRFKYTHTLWHGNTGGESKQNNDNGRALIQGNVEFSSHAMHQFIKLFLVSNFLHKGVS